MKYRISRTCRTPRLRRTAILAGLALAAAACVETGTPDRVEIEGDTTGEGAAVIPMERIGPGDAALVVPVHVNGQGPHDFVLDTGATLTCIDASLADSLQLEDATGQIGTGMGIGGEQPGAMRLIQIDSLRIGDARAEGLTGCAIDLAQFRSAGLDIHGLLGLNVLTRFRVTLDFQEQQLTLERP